MNRGPLPSFAKNRVYLAFAVGFLAVPLAAQSMGLEMLQGLSKGEWTIKYRDGSADRKVCVATGEELIQLQHMRSSCDRFVVEEASAKVTVQYTCPGEGYGRTDIRRETSSLVQLQSQGISSGVPFQFSAEARLTGTC
ncbi:MAG: hypothetical protein AAGB23_12825 [Pseudomonadota bacterium]